MSIHINLMVVEQDGWMFLPTKENYHEVFSKPGQIRPITISASLAEKLIKGVKIRIESERT